MNYNEDGKELTPKDRKDLAELYRAVWDNQITSFMDELTGDEVEVVLVQTDSSAKVFTLTAAAAKQKVAVRDKSFVSSAKIANQIVDIPTVISVPGGATEKDVMQLGVLIGKLLNKYSKEQVAQLVNQVLANDNE